MRRPVRRSPARKCGMGEHYDTPPCVHCSLGVIMKNDLVKFMRDNPDYIPPDDQLRVRNFACVVYEVDKSKWISVLDSFHVPCYISPLHDQDLNIYNERKVPHYHVMIMFDGNKSISQVKKLFDQIGGVGLEVVQTMRGYARYFCHLDNPSKFRYQESDVVELSGALPYLDLISSSSDKVSATREMMFVIKSNKIRYFSEFVDYCVEFRPEWHYLLLNGCVIFIKEYIKSFAYELRQREISEDNFREWE